MIVRHENRMPRELQPGVTHTVLSHNDDLMLCEVRMDRDVTFPTHAHPHTQTVYVVSGRVRFKLGERVIDLEAGDSCLIEPHIAHGLIALEDACLLDAFTPVRSDFVPFGPVGTS
jgi:quercetin dioxygenase-like cupin family protein